MTPRFSVLLPVHRPPAMLPFAIETVLAQTVSDFELLVICDGAPEATAACAREFGVRDPRVKTLVFPKGERHGEAHRDAVLRQATGELVAQIADDDLWLPDHLAELAGLLADVDFGNVIHVNIDREDIVHAIPCDLSDPMLRRRMLNEAFNRFGPTFCGYRMEAYRRLPEGWAPAPLEIWTDLHMWRKFLRRDDITAATRAVVTGIGFPAVWRTELSPEARGIENVRWLRRIQDPNQRRAIVEAAIHSLCVQCVGHEQRAAAAAAALSATPPASDAKPPAPA